MLMHCERMSLAGSWKRKKTLCPEWSGVSMADAMRTEDARLTSSSQAVRTSEFRFYPM